MNPYASVRTSFFEYNFILWKPVLITFDSFLKTAVWITFDSFLTTAIWYNNVRNSIELSYISILTWHSTISEEDIFLNFWFWFFLRIFFVLIFWQRNFSAVKNVYTSRNLIKTSGNFLVKLQSENIKKWKITRIYIVFCSNIWGNQCESWSPQLQL